MHALKPFRHTASAVILLSLLLLAPAKDARGQQKVAEGKDPIFGTWLLDTGRSDFGDLQAPHKQTMIFESVPNGWHHSISTLNFFDFTDAFDYSAKFDRMDYPMPTDSPLNSVTLKRVSAFRYERDGKSRGKIVEKVVYEVSKDGKTLTITTDGAVNNSGFHTVQVFTKQKS